MRFLIFGAGAIGTYIGGSLLLARQPVVFLERPDAAADLKQRGLNLEIKGERHVISHLLVADTIEEALEQGPFTAGIVAIKSYDTPALVQSFTTSLKWIPPILCLQNGVENEPTLAGVLGADRVIPGTVTSAVGRLGIGAIRLERLRGVGVATGHPISADLVSTLNLAGLHAQSFQDAERMKWSKMFTNLIANASSAILDMTPGQIFADGRLYRLEIAQLRETLRVMNAYQLRIVNLPGVPVRLLAWAIWNLLPSLSQPLLARAIAGGRGAKMPSFHIDLHNGRGRNEVEFLNGAVVRFGERAGIPTPVNRALNETLLALTSGQLSIQAFAHQPEKLIAITHR
ncbi:MAG: 2-dehydropantoate 2-reductase [Anaerolineaceae bacterium]|nr:2-dehydropantoate 2-reductase [Anaerolineaceae bacterium]